jgi:tetratricopeptide (TPR) repeat protein
MRRPSLRCAGALFFVLIVTGWAARPVRADEAADRQAAARKLTKEGLAHYDLKEYDEAIDSYKKAYALYPVPVNLFNLAKAYRDKGDRENALYFFRMYLREKPDAKDRAYVEASIAELEKQQKAPHSEPTVVLPAPGHPEPPSKLAPPVTAAPPGPARANVQLMARPAWYADTWGWIITGTGVVACGVGFGYLGSAADLEDEAKTADEARVPGLLDTASNRRNIGRWAVGIGAGVAVLGIVKLAVGETAPPSARSVQVSLGPTWIGFSGRF